ncbi:MAG: thioredoxin domain-containing protein [Proteobacteria bacterium]|nr:thioredoxin domain-containing protein [Pseudomonadota bacterium]
MGIFPPNICKPKGKQVILFIAICLVIFAFFFKGFTAPVFAAEALVPSFGMGKINVRLYTDYFCSPCRDMEPNVEPIISELVKKNVINITFVDTPFSRASMLYARHFLYIMNEKKDFDHVLNARSVLIGASLEKITEEAKLEEYLRDKGIKFKPFDVKPVFNILNNYLKEDKIQATPACVVDQDGKIERYSGGSDIIKALKNLK